MLRGLAHYRLIQPLGLGTQGRAFLALDSRLQRRVCIKIYDLDSSRAARRRAIDEAWQLTRVESPRVCQVYDVVHSGDQLALVTRYLKGCALADLLGPGAPLPPANVIAIVSDIAAALAALRRAKLVHGDLKSANVIIDPTGRASLVDFGVAVFAGESFYGHSWESLSPEQSQSEAATLRSDFFALGLLLYQMLVGEHPFYRDGELHVPSLRRGLRAPPNLPGLGCAETEALQGLLLSLLAADPAHRPAGTFELREELRKLRALFSAPADIRRSVVAAIPRPPSDPGFPRLPRALVKLPRWQQAQAWLASYWRRGSAGARGLLLGALVLPFALLIVMHMRPGHCVSVAMPEVYVYGSAALDVPRAPQLQETLTAVIKQLAEDLVVLGAGPASDSKPVMTPYAIHDVCIAQRSIDLQLQCDERCLLQLQASGPHRAHTAQLVLAPAADSLTLTDALGQLVGEQLGLLRQGL